MKKGGTTRREQYAEIMKRVGIAMEDCKIVAFGFSSESQMSRFHYLVMVAEGPYYLYDQVCDVAQLIIPNKNGVEDEFVQLARECGGEPTNPKLI